MRSLIKYFIVGWLIASLFVIISKSSDSSFSTSIGGPVEIARPNNYYYKLASMFLLKGIIEPCVIGLLVYGILRWGHPEYQASVIQPLLFSTVVWLAWGLLGLVGLPRGYEVKTYYLAAVALYGVGLAVAAARLGYYCGCRTKQPVEDTTGLV